MEMMNEDLLDFNVEGGSTTSAPKKEKSRMAIKVTTPTMINGRSDDSYSVDDLISLIVDSELAIEGFLKVNTESKTVGALVARERGGIADLVKVLDTRKID
jgi:hypothetical protein